jgi:hypothetical protein
VVGRARASTLRILDDEVSSIHAELIWEGERWQLRDLGSCNGTFVNGRKLAAGELIDLAPGVTMTFGGAANRYRLVELGPPEKLESQQLIMACARTWRITVSGAPARPRETAAQPMVSGFTLEFLVSRDREHVELAIGRGEHVDRLEGRAYLFLLLELARARLADAEQQPHLAESEHGWLYRERLLEQFNVDLQLLNLWVFRARKQIAGVGVDGAARLIERRSATQQLRIGFGNLRIVDA